MSSSTSVQGSEAEEETILDIAMVQDDEGTDRYNIWPIVKYIRKEKSRWEHEIQASINMFLELEDLEKGRSKWWKVWEKSLKEWGEIWIDDTKWEIGRLFTEAMEQIGKRERRIKRLKKDKEMYQEVAAELADEIERL